MSGNQGLRVTQTDRSLDIMLPTPRNTDALTVLGLLSLLALVGFGFGLWHWVINTHVKALLPAQISGYVLLACLGGCWLVWNSSLHVSVLNDRLFYESRYGGRRGVRYFAYSVRDVRQLRVVDNTPQCFMTPGRTMSSTSILPGAIAFEADGQPVRLGGTLDAKQALRVVELLQPYLHG